MIGQKNIQTRINTLIDNNTFPRFAILTGQRGCGKKTLCKQIAKKLGGNVVTIGVGIDDVRDMIDQAYKVATKTIFIIADADKMSMGAKNALLKVTEEPPNNAYFIMTLQSMQNTLETLKSRGTEFSMDIYTPDELKCFMGANTKDIDTVINLCDTPLAVQQLLAYNLKDFDDYVKLVVDNIHLVSGSNSFKIENKIAFNENDEGYDLMLFWRAFQKECVNRIMENPMQYAKGIEITNKAITDLRTNTINRLYVFDIWLLDIRREWMKFL